MKALARLESILQDLMERPQWLLTPKRIHPLELASALTRAFEAQVLPLGDRVVAPNRFTVSLHPDDLDQLGPVRTTLERELAMYVSRAAQERGLTLPAAPEVRFTAGDSVRMGDVEVRAQFAEASAPPATLHGTPAPIQAGFTERMQRVDLPPPPVAHDQPVLEMLADNERVLRMFPLDGTIVTIGRRSGNDIALLDLEVSRQHARIDFVAPSYFVADVGSTNGTLVNGRQVQGRHQLRDGDVIGIGKQRLRFRDPRPAARAR